MNVSSTYRTVILLLEPDCFQEKILKYCEQGAIKFLKLSRMKLQSQLQIQMKEEISELSRRSVELLSQRFTGSLGEKAIIPFDERNSKFVFENNSWFVEIRPTRDLKHGDRIKIPCARSEVEYYHSIQELSTFPFFITRENDKWFAYISIPENEKTISSKTTVGIDFNIRQWVAASKEGRPLFFEVISYNKEVEEINRKLSSIYSKWSREDKKRPSPEDQKEIDILYLKRGFVLKRAQGNFLAKIKSQFGTCVLKVEDVKTMYKMIRGLKSKLTNNWLNQKTSLSQFILRAMAHGFEVKEVSPYGSSHECFRCHMEGEVYGAHQRLFRCMACGLTDYNRDLNAARVLAQKV
jgi:transposase